MWGWMFSAARSAGRPPIRQPSGANLGVMFAYLVFSGSFLASIIRKCRARGHGMVAGFIAVIGGLALYYQSQGNLHDAYLWAWRLPSATSIRDNIPVCWDVCHRSSVCDLVVGFVVVLWHPSGNRDPEIFARQDRIDAGGVARFVVGCRLSDDLYWMAVSGPLSSAGASAVVDSRGPGVLALHCETAAFSPTALATGANGHHQRGRNSGDRLSDHGVRGA